MRAIATALLALIFLVLPGAVGAQMLCQERDQVLAKLAASYRESPVAMGLASNGSLIEVLTSARPDGDEGDTWTVIVTQPNGISCVMATGESWQDIDRLAMHLDPQL